MRKKVIGVLLIMVFFLVPIQVHASSNDVLYSMNFWYNNNAIMQNGAIVNYNGKVMVPVKTFADAIGASAYLNRDTMTYTVSRRGVELVFNLNDNTVMVNGKYVWANAPMQIIEQRFYVPAAFMANKFGMKTYINYDKNRYEVYPSGNNGTVNVKVEFGDTLNKLASWYGVTVDWIKNQNKPASDMIYPGQMLIMGYCDQEYSYGAYASKNATLESGAGFAYADKGYLAAWTAITIKGKTGVWYYASTPKGIGYIHESVLWIDQGDSGFIGNSNYFNKEFSYSTAGDYISYKNYTVVKGDTIWSIATKNGITERDLRQANNLNYDYLSIGQVIKIPVRHIGIKSVPSSGYGEVLDWMTQGQYVFSLNKIGVLIDMETGARIQVKRTTGATHADTEALTKADSQALKNAFGGSWSWERKPFLLEIDGRRYAVSVSAMPHAGVDGVAYLQNVSGRSGGYGYGPNYDAISGNGMEGHFDLYFLNGRRHKDGQIDPQHQATVLIAGGLQ